ncbi:SDR family oxidoreductase [soil metagenome]
MPWPSLPATSRSPNSPLPLLVFGFGYVGEALTRRVIAGGGSAMGTIRRPEDAARLEAMGVRPVLLDDPVALDAAVSEAKTILITAPPSGLGCPALPYLIPAMARTGAFPDWIGYLSTTGVYGDREGRWVDERSHLAARSIEGARRVAAERDWLEIGRGLGLTVTIFRLPGIYGPGRSALDRLRDGAARRIAKPGHVFSRAHRDDIAAALEASMARPRPGGIYNVCDDEPAPGEAVILHAAALLGMEPPPPMSEPPAAASRFYGENKRVSNARAKAELSWRPAYPTYREGLAAILSGGG